MKRSDIYNIWLGLLKNEIPGLVTLEEIMSSWQKMSLELETIAKEKPEDSKRLLALAGVPLEEKN